MARQGKSKSEIGRDRILKEKQKEDRERQSERTRGKILKCAALWDSLLAQLHVLLLQAALDVQQVVDLLLELLL